MNNSSYYNSRSSSSSRKSKKEQLENMERGYIKICTSVAFALGYFFISRYFLNWISRKYFPEMEMEFRWNILDFVKETREGF